MNGRNGKVALAFLAALLVGLVSAVGYPQRQDPDKGAAASAQSKSPAGDVSRQKEGKPASSDIIMSPEEKQVRDTYARLMRYQSAAVEYDAATTGIPTKPDDYVVFELRDLHSGPVDEISDRPVGDIVTSRAGDVTTVTPHHLVYGLGPRHAYYNVGWDGTAQPGASGPRSVAETLTDTGAKYRGATQYTSYEVTVRLSGRQRTYRAVALHRGTSQLSGKPNTMILDNVTPEMNTVLADESPRVISPWDKYIKSDLYLAVAKAIREAGKSGRPLIPPDAPIGYLPGDDAILLAARKQITPEAGCPIPTVNISAAQTIMDGSTSSFSVSTPDATPSAYSWSFTVPSGGGNGPSVDFTAPGSANTGTDGHWFAYPDQECPNTNCAGTYTIYCSVSFSFLSNPILVSTTLAINGCWFPAGITDPNEARVTGAPTIGVDAQGIWHVTGMGTLGRQIPHKQVLVPATSQFFQKADAHEQAHVDNWGSGQLFGNTHQPADFYARIKDFTGTSEDDLVSKLIADLKAYTDLQDAFVAANHNRDEQIAYAVSDAIAPRYLYQNCGRY